MSRDAHARAEVAASASPSPEVASAPAVDGGVVLAKDALSPTALRTRRNAKNARALSVIRNMGAFTAREKSRLVREILQVRGLMPLLMKPRNGQRWTPEDKAELVGHLRRLSKLSPYLVIGVMPGGFLLLPLLAWWLDRRRNRTANRRTTET